MVKRSSNYGDAAWTELGNQMHVPPNTMSLPSGRDIWADVGRQRLQIWVVTVSLAGPSHSEVAQKDGAPFAKIGTSGA